MRIARSVTLSILSALAAILLCAWLISQSPIRVTAGDPLSTWSVVRMMFGGGPQTGSPLASTASLLSHAGRSLLLFGISVGVAMVIGTALGLFRAVRKGPQSNAWIREIPILAMPVPLVSAVLATVVVYRLHLLPVSGFESVPPFSGVLSRAADVVRHLALPALVMMLGDGNLRDFAGFAHASAQRDVQTGFVELSRGFAIPKRVIVWKYLSRSAAAGVFDSLRVRLPLLLGGTIVVESIFTINGIGYLFVQSVERNDVQILSRVTLWFIVLTTLLSIAADVATRARERRTILPRTLPGQPPAVAEV